MQVSGKMITGIFFVLLFCTAAGCTSFTKTKPSDLNTPPGSSGGGSGGGPGGGGGGSGGGSGGSSSGSYPQNTYFSFDCKGEYKASGMFGEPPWNRHGKFTLTGNMPFPIPYDYNNMAGYALYTATDAKGAGMSSPLHLNAELQGCYGTADDCQPCHFIFDGDIYAGGSMVFNQKAGPERRWTVVFMQQAGEEGIWHINSFTQTEGGCPLTWDKDKNPVELVMPALSCYPATRGADSGVPFTFSDGSGFVVSPTIEPHDIVFTSLDPRVVFHIGRAPS